MQSTSKLNPNYNHQTRLNSEIQGWFNICKAVSIIHKINQAKAKNLFILATYPERAFDINIIDDKKQKF